MRRLTHEQYRDRLYQARPRLTLLERYCKARVPIAVRCEDCGTTFSREANAHLRFACPTCSRTTSDPT